MTGFSVSSGNVSIASTRFLMSVSAWSSSAPVRSSTITAQAPSTAEERISSMPSTPSISSSMRMQTPSSTSSGAAPRYSTSIRIMSMSMSGNVFCVMTGMVASPPTTSISMIRLAAT
jgi:hypothetical protein